MKMKFMDVVCEAWRWVELAEDCDHYWALLLVVLNLHVLLPQC